MIELPEAIVLSKQLNNALTGATVTEVFNSNSPHKFTFFYGNTSEYKQLLVGKRILSVRECGIFINISLEDNIKISFNDGIKLYYGNSYSKIPEKYQLLLTFSDEKFLAFTVTMYGGIAVYKGMFKNEYYEKNLYNLSPMDRKFDMTYFQNLMNKEKKNISIKAFLATEQRVPGIGNGVLQDILFNASINPKRKILSLEQEEKEKLFQSIKSTLLNMVEHGGRDTEIDIYGNKGGYITTMSKKTYKHKCLRCGSAICKENYMGGSVYYCPNCQQLK